MCSNEIISDNDEDEKDVIVEMKNRIQKDGPYVIRIFAKKMDFNWY